jgi:hypothetical protein
MKMDSKVVSVDRRIEVRSKSELFATRDFGQKNGIDKQNELNFFRISKLSRLHVRQKNHQLKDHEMRYSRDGATVRT